jgi:molybdenum cofactor cytidylyltransferase
VPAGWDAALICLGDMPRIEPAVLRALAAASGEVVVPVWQGKRGNPVRWQRQHFAALSGLSGDVGGKALLSGLPAPPTEIAAISDAILDDIDTPDALAALRRRAS